MKFFKKKKKVPQRTLEEMMRRSEDEVVRESEEMSEEDTDTCDNVENDAKQVSEFNVLNCFGLKEDKAEKWMIKCAKVWYAIMCLCWFLLGTLSFAPVLFIANKMETLFKDKKKALLASIILYCAIIALLIMLITIRKSSRATVS